MMRYSYESHNTDFTSAIAASANAVHSLEVSSSKSQIARSNTSKQEPQQGGLIRKASTEDTMSSSTLKPATSFADDQRHKQTSATTKSDTWEKAQIAKIRKRYEKLHSEIQAWENERKLGEKSRMERMKGDLQVRKSRNLKHYYYKIARIGNVAHGARARVEEKRKHEESIIKDTARKMRSTRKTSVTCFCF